MMGAAVWAWSQSKPTWTTDSGNWTWNARENRLYQNSDTATMAKANIPVGSQSGTMLYEFNVRYEGSLDVTHAGFGVHLFVDKPSNRHSWGTGHSYLFWLNYDAHPRDSHTPAGLSAQVYYSKSPAHMELLASADLNRYMDYLTADVVYHPVAVKIQVNADTGEICVWSPFDPTLYFTAYVDPAKIKSGGQYVTLRTNSMPASFGYGLGADAQ
jgi:hypothetical protein